MTDTTQPVSYTHLDVYKRQAVVSAEFHELGLGDPLSISSAHGEGVKDIIDLALESFHPTEDEPELDKTGDRVPKVAIVGRPNVGKSTLVNALLGEERVIAFDEPGTTRDSISIDLEKNGKHYTLIDTAGVRKRGRVLEAIEKFSVKMCIRDRVRTLPNWMAQHCETCAKTCKWCFKIRLPR